MSDLYLIHNYLLISKYDNLVNFRVFKAPFHLTLCCCLYFNVKESSRELFFKLIFLIIGKCMFHRFFFNSMALILFLIILMCWKFVYLHTSSGKWILTITAVHPISKSLFLIKLKNLKIHTKKQQLLNRHRTCFAWFNLKS